MTATPMTETNKQTWQGYNGWANYETWNASLWINNTPFYLDTASGCSDYMHFQDMMIEMFGSDSSTGDGVKWTDPMIDHEEMNEMLDELHDSL